MLYCPKCQRLTRGEECPECGKRRGMRAPAENDPVLLTAARFVQAAMLEQLLGEKEIPFAKVSQTGFSATFGGTGGALESFLFYVPFGAWESARQTAEDFFIEDEEMQTNLRECAE